MVLVDTFRKDVKVRISPLERSEYTPPAGIEVRWYPYQDKDKEVCSATFMATSAMPRPNEIRDMNDINEELSKLKVVQDNITIKDEPLLVKNFGIGVYAMIDTPVYDGERDHYRSRPKEEYQIPVPMDTFNKMNDDIERLSPILPTERKRYALTPQHQVTINDKKHVMMRFARIL
jgi:hypothetical protein